MLRGEKILPEMIWAILRLSKLLKNEQITMCIGVSERSIRRIISHFQEHGTIEAIQSVQEECNNNRHL
jgi:transcription initiation factor IIE alpha subunit